MPSFLVYANLYIPFMESDIFHQQDYIDIAVENVCIISLFFEKNCKKLGMKHFFYLLCSKNLIIMNR